MGQIAPCPTCERSFALLPDIAIPSAKANNRALLPAEEYREANKTHESYVARVRREPATEKQKDKLRWFGYAFKETISKGEASDALDKCARDFPEKNRAYYNRPATNEQLEQLRLISKKCRAKSKDNSALTYGQAKDAILDWKMQERTISREREFEQIAKEHFFEMSIHFESEFSPQVTARRVKLAAKELNRISPGWMKKDDGKRMLRQKVAELYPGVFEEHLRVKCWEERGKLTELFKLKGLPPLDEDLAVIRQNGITYHSGDAFSVRALADLVRCFEELLSESSTGTNISMACEAAAADPAFQKAIIILDQWGNVVFTWPKQKLHQWFRRGAKF